MGYRHFPTAVINLSLQS